MADNRQVADPFADALPGYEVHFHVYGRGVTATLFEVAYRRGRRHVITRMALPVEFEPGPEGHLPLSTIRSLCEALVEVLSGP